MARRVVNDGSVSPVSIRQRYVRSIPTFVASAGRERFFAFRARSMAAPVFSAAFVRLTVAKNTTQPARREAKCVQHAKRPQI